MRPASANFNQAIKSPALNASTDANQRSLNQHTHGTGEQDEGIAHAMKLLLAARERVLTLAEQRVSG